MRQFLYTYGPFEFTLLQLKFSTHPSSALILATPIAEIQGYIKINFNVDIYSI